MPREKNEVEDERMFSVNDMADFATRMVMDVLKQTIRIDNLSIQDYINQQLEDVPGQ